MAKELEKLDENRIKSRIYTIRGQQVMLDEDLAAFFKVETRFINQAVKRNIARFPEGFVFKLTKEEYLDLKSQYVIPKGLRFQNGTSRLEHGGRRHLPYVFTEQGVAMLSGLLRSDIAVKVSIQIINAFVAMRRFIANNAQVFYRLESVERKQIKHDLKFEQIFKAIETKDIKPKKGIFFEGQVFDAYKFVSDVIRSAKHSIILIDNFVDDSVFSLLNKRKKGVKAKVFTKKVSNQLKLDLEKYNSQYPKIELKEFNHSHDRFLIIDSKELYHIGASLKDLGKKWFAFSRFDKDALRVLDKLQSQE